MLKWNAVDDRGQYKHNSKNGVNGMKSRFQTIIEKFIRWGETSGRLYAALIVGSQAREDHPADEYAAAWVAQAL